MTQVTESDGSSSTYTYDANGNVTSITRVAGTSTLTIGSISAYAGAAGSQITILGSGFSSTASQDTVSFDGIAGQIVYASGNRLVVTVPAGATSGDISITTPSGTQKTTSAFTILPVAITGFAPAVAAAGTTVTVSGGGFSATASQDTVSVNGTKATVLSASATQITFTVPAAATSGHITVTTPTSSASSGGFLVVPSEGYIASNLAAVGEPALNGSGLVMTVDSDSQVALALFDGTQGQFMNIALTEVSMSGTYKVYSPSGVIVGSGTIADNMIVELPALPATGTYSLYLIPSSAVGSATVGVLAAVTGAVATSGTPIAVSLISGQGAAYSFTGTSGQSYSLALTSVVGVAGSYLAGTIVNSAGVTVANCGGYYAGGSPAGNCDFAITTTGTYTVLVEPSVLGATTFNLIVNADLAETLTAGSPGATVNLNLPTAGQHGLLHFTATAGETLALYVTVTSTAASYVTISVSGPSGSLLSNVDLSGQGVSTTFNLRNLAAGTYSVLVTPYNNATASLQAALATGITGTIPTTGASETFKTTVPGQNAYLTFAATAGQNLGLGITQISLTPPTPDYLGLNVTAPNGASVTSATCYSTSTPGCQLSFSNLPQTGNYSLVVSPGGQSTIAVTFNLTVDSSGALSLTTPTNISLTTPGADASLTFTATSGESLAIDLSAITTSPANTPIIVYVYNAAGTLVASTSTVASGSLSLPNLAAGNYTVLVVPSDAATGSVKVGATTDVTASLTVGTPYNLSVPNSGQDAWLSFTATAAENLVLEATSLVTTPANSTVTISVYNSSGGKVASGTASTSASGSISLSNLAAGTYNVLVHPNTTSASMTLTLLNGIYNSLPATGGSASISAAAGQNAYFSFPATAGQSFAFALSNLTTSSPGAQITVTAPNGTVLPQISCAPTTPVCAASLLNLLAGVYNVTVSTSAWGAYALSFTATLSPDVTANLSAGTPYGLSATKVGQDAWLNFVATAGQNFSVELSNVVTNPANGSVAFSVYGPGAGGALVGSSSATTSQSNVANLTNLAAGTYYVLVHPSSTSASMTVTSINNPTVVLPTSGSGVNVSDVAGENAYLSFSGTAGENVTVALSNLVMPSGYAYVWINTPSGANMGGAYCYPSTPVCSINLPNLPVTGTYGLLVSTSLSGVLPMSFTANVAPYVTGSLTVGTPSNLSLPKIGQDGLVTFTATAGQTLALEVTNVVTTPANSNVTVIITGPGASTTQVGSGYVSSAGGTTFNLPNLAAGSYSVFVNPSTTSSSMTLTLLSNPVVALPTTGSGVNVSDVAGENAYLTFSGTAGENLTFTLSNLVLASGYANVVISEPNGAQWSGGLCSPGTVCSINLENLPATGTYSVSVSRYNGTQYIPMSFTVTVAQDVTASLTAGTAYNLSLPKTGQVGLLTFTATAGQTFALEVTNVVTTPANTNVPIIIAGPGASTTQVGSGYVSSAGGTTFNIPNLAAGSYSVFVNPSTTSSSMTLTLLSNPTTNLPASGSSVSVSEPAGENAYLSFSATAGQNMTFTITDLVMPSGYAYVWINASGNGSILFGQYCYPGALTCSVSMDNLPSTGTYNVLVSTSLAGLLPMSFTANVRQDLTATLTQGTPYNLNLTQVGQDAWLTFTLSATTTVNLQINGVTTSPAGNTVIIDVYNSAGSTVAAGGATTSTTITMANLAAGTYSVLVHPSSVTASMSVQF